MDYDNLETGKVEAPSNLPIGRIIELILLGLILWRVWNG